MKTFTVSHNVVHLWQGCRRTESERVSQVLLGATVSVLDETEDGWVYAESDDTYRGWMEKRLLMTPGTQDAPQLSDAPQPPVMGESALVSVPFADVRERPDAGSPLVVRLSIGSKLSAQDANAEGWRRVTLPGGEAGWVCREALALVEKTPVEWAGEFLGTPYLWGGSSAFGLDCSGLAQMCYRLAGVVLRRDADIQRSDPRFIPVEGERKPGDLVFFGNKSEEKITHVGLDLGDGRFIHSAGGMGVIITTWDGDDRYAPAYIDARRLDPARAGEPVTRFEAEDR